MVVMMLWYGGHWAFWQASLMWLGMIVFWGLLVWAIYALVTAATRKPPRGDHDGDPGQRMSPVARPAGVECLPVMAEAQARSPRGSGRA
jgi:hypothetical protein